MTPFETQCSALQATVDMRSTANTRMIAALNDNGVCDNDTQLTEYLGAAKLHSDAEKIASYWRP